MFCWWPPFTMINSLGYNCIKALAQHILGQLKRLLPWSISPLSPSHTRRGEGSSPTLEIYFFENKNGWWRTGAGPLPYLYLRLKWPKTCWFYEKLRVAKFTQCGHWKYLGQLVSVQTKISSAYPLSYGCYLKHCNKVIYHQFSVGVSFSSYHRLVSLVSSLPLPLSVEVLDL